jgi:hypothetical protein
VASIKEEKKLRDYLKRGCDDEDDNKAKICETLDEA